MVEIRDEKMSILKICIVLSKRFLWFDLFIWLIIDM